MRSYMNEKLLTIKEARAFLKETFNLSISKPTMIRLVKEWKMDRWVGHKIVISEKLLRAHIAEWINEETDKRSNSINQKRNTKKRRTD